MADIRSYFTGFCMHPECMILPHASWRKKHIFPAQSFIVSTTEGSFAWDTGYATHFFQSMRGVYRLYNMVTPVHSNQTQSLRVQLERDHITIDKIVLSHLHADHMAGLHDFPNMPVYASQSAWSSVEGKKGIRSLLQAYVPSLLPVGTEQRSVEEHFRMVDLRMHPELSSICADTFIAHGWYIDDSHEAIVIALPGHAKGHLGLFVRCSDGWHLIASDAAWSHFAYMDDQIVLPHQISFIIQDDKVAYTTTLKTLQTLHRRGIRIHLSHERRSALRMLEDRAHQDKKRNL